MNSELDKHEYNESQMRRLHEGFADARSRSPSDDAQVDRARPYSPQSQNVPGNENGKVLPEKGNVFPKDGTEAESSRPAATNGEAL